MVKIYDNVILEGIVGGLGKMLVFRKRKGKVSVYLLSPRKVPFTQKQKEWQQRFAIAVSKARNAMKEDKERKQFENIARETGKSSAYGAAVSWFMNNPDE